MLRKLTALGVFVLALAPSAYLAWTLRAMPHLGFYHDDSIYWVSAKSLAEGRDYRIASLPGEPYQTKYPPLYPALLAGVWKIEPNFPANLPLATLFSWLLFPVYLAVVWAFLRQWGFGWREQCILVLVAGLSPVAAAFSFLNAGTAVHRVIRGKRAAGRALAFGRSFALAAGAGRLVWSIGVPHQVLRRASAVDRPAVFRLAKAVLEGRIVLAGDAAWVVGWQWWTARHLSPSWDLVTLYYTNYLGFQIYNVPLRDLPLVVWHNLDGFLLGAGRLLTFDVPYGAKPFERVVAVAAIAGSVRLIRKTRKLQYPLAALGISAILLIWHYVPDQRFVFPLYPLLLAGLWTEIANVWQALGAAWKKPAVADRVVAFAGAGMLAAFALFVAFSCGFGLFYFLPDLFASYRAAFESRRPAYQWIAQNAPPEANVFAYDDPLIYLYTGRKACNLPIPPKLYYHNDEEGIDKLLHSIPDFARRYQLSYLLLTPSDFYRDLHQPGARHLAEAVEHSNSFQPSFKTPGVAIYRFTPLNTTQASLVPGR